MSQAAGMLHGITVVDLTRVLSGPYCTLVLADLGADVIKVEPPGGDDSRRSPPLVNGVSAYFAAFNRGKRSIVLDLKIPADKATFDALLDRADVLAENYRPGVMAKLGYGPDVIAQRWPRLIHASISGFGQSGPAAARPAYDLIIQAMGGIMSLTGAEDGGPARVGTSLVDLGSGLFAALGILAALQQRHRTGRGAHIDIAMLDSLVALLEHALLRAQAGDTPHRTGARFPTAAPADAFRTADGWIVIGTTNQAQYAAAMTAVGRPDLIADSRFAAPADRLARQAALKIEIEQALAAKDTASWDAVLINAGVACGPVRGVADLLTDPQLQHRGLFVEAAGLKTAGNPIKVTGQETMRATPAPALDGDRAAILASLKS
jgi:CoA:oxalate CoA-transferase